VYFDRLFPMGVEAMLEALDLVKSGKAPKVQQDEAKATYEGWCTAENGRIDWGRQGYQIHNLVRGCNPAPGAWTTLNGRKIQIFETKKLPARDPKGIGGAMGEVMEVDGEGFTVACADGRIRVLRVRGDAGKVTGAEFASASGLQPGARLGS
jgi:methionyl-tRNA formyltransferase